jgi:hypothetical protein
LALWVAALATEAGARSKMVNESGTKARDFSLLNVGAKAPTHKASDSAN